MRAGGKPTPQPSVSIERLKAFARNRLPTGHPLREVLLTERDKLAPEEFLAKMDIWLRLLPAGT